MKIQYKNKYNVSGDLDIFHDSAPEILVCLYCHHLELEDLS